MSVPGVNGNYGVRQEGSFNSSINGLSYSPEEIRLAEKTILTAYYITKVAKAEQNAAQAADRRDGHLNNVKKLDIEIAQDKEKAGKLEQDIKTHGETILAAKQRIAERATQSEQRQKEIEAVKARIAAKKAAEAAAAAAAATSSK